MPRGVASAKKVVSTSTACWRAKRANTRTSIATRKKRPHCSERPILLWVDDYKLGLELYRAMFESSGFRVLTASSGREGVKLAAQNQVDVVVTDYEMPGMNGEAVAAAVKRIDPAMPVVLFSGSTIVSPRSRGLFDAFCDKAGSRNLLSSTIHRMLLKKRSPFLQPQLVTRASDSHRTVA